MKTHRIISTDSHVVEPLYLWEERLPAKYRGRGPRVEEKNGEKFLIIDGGRPRNLKYTIQGAKATNEVEREKAKAGGWDVSQRMKDQDRDGVIAEVVYPTVGGRTAFFTHDADFALEAAKLYNDWIAEVFGARKDRFAPVAVVPLMNVEGAVAEVRRVEKLGLRALMLPAHPPEREYNDSVYDPVWATAQELGLSCNFHAGSGHEARSAQGAGGAVINYVIYALADGQRVSTYLCGSGVLDRFPSLQIATVETGSGWLAWVLLAMDEAYQKHHLWAYPKLSMLPSEYFKRQGHTTFQDDPVGIANRHRTGVHTLMWGNDYPHFEGTWPHSQEAVNKQCEGVPEDEIELIVRGNAAKLYRFQN